MLGSLGPRLILAVPMTICGDGKNRFGDVRASSPILGLYRYTKSQYKRIQYPTPNAKTP